MFDTIVTIVGFAVLFYFLYKHINKLNNRISNLEKIVLNNRDDNTLPQNNIVQSMFSKFTPDFLNNSESNKLYDLSSQNDTTQQHYENLHEDEKSNESEEEEGEEEEGEEEEGEKEEGEEEEGEEEEGEEKEGEEEEGEEEEGEEEEGDEEEGEEEEGEEEEGEEEIEKQYLTDKMPDDDVEQNLDAIIDELSSDNPNDIEDIKEQVKNMTEFMETPSKTQKKRGRKKKISL